MIILYSELQHQSGAAGGTGDSAVGCHVSDAHCHILDACGPTCLMHNSRAITSPCTTPTQGLGSSFHPCLVVLDLCAATSSLARATCAGSTVLPRPRASALARTCAAAASVSSAERLGGSVPSSASHGHGRCSNGGAVLSGMSTLSASGALRWGKGRPAAAEAAAARDGRADSGPRISRYLA